MDNLSLSFTPGLNTQSHLPLGRYLPPIPNEMILNWLAKVKISAGQWVLDPFGTTPLLCLEASKAGYKTLVFSNNPILSFMIRTLASAPINEDFQTALAFLSKERWQDTRLETHLKNLYITTCDTCDQEIQASSYFWNENEPYPFSKTYRCPYCQTEGEFAINVKDRQVLDIIKTDQLQRARALQRVLKENDPNENNVKNILKTYQPRPLYFVLTLQNRLDRSSIPERYKNLLTALLISCFDRANTLWPKTSGRSRPKQIGSPSQFKELNLWEILEKSIAEWTGNSQAIPLTLWPNLPDSENGGICLYEGRIRDFGQIPSQFNIKYAFSVLPRPNQAFWSYSAIWAGWLWGREAVKPIYASLSRQRYDWNWLSTAYHSIFTALKKTTNSNTDLLALMAEAEPGFFSAQVAGTKCSGYKLEGAAYRREEKIIQTQWKPHQHMQPPLEGKIPDICQSSLISFMNNRNEPLEYFDLFSQGLLTYEEINETQKDCNSQPVKYQKQFQKILNGILTKENIWKRYNFLENNPESGLWWLMNPEPISDLTLNDRLESEIIKYLYQHPQCRLNELDKYLCSVFKGFYSPSPEFILTCMESYASQSDESRDVWNLKPNETRDERLKDIEQIKNSLIRIGEKLNLATTGSKRLYWINKKGEKLFEFNILSTSIIGPFLLDPPVREYQKKFIIIPGSRSRLLNYKLDKDPRLKEGLNRYNYFLKFRHIQNIVEKKQLNMAVWDELIYFDPPDFSEPKQISMF